MRETFAYRKAIHLELRKRTEIWTVNLSNKAMKKIFFRVHVAPCSHGCVSGCTSERKHATTRETSEEGPTRETSEEGPIRETTHKGGGGQACEIIQVYYSIPGI